MALGVIGSSERRLLTRAEGSIADRARATRVSSFVGPVDEIPTLLRLGRMIELEQGPSPTSDVTASL